MKYATTINRYPMAQNPAKNRLQENARKKCDLIINYTFGVCACELQMRSNSICHYLSQLRVPPECRANSTKKMPN